MADHEQGFCHPKCYAGSLGDCCTEISGEHCVSAELLRRGSRDKMATVTNLGFQRERNVPQRIGIANLKAKVLCKVHNSRLSDYDQAILQLHEGIEALEESFGQQPADTRRFRVDGDALERWLLKMLAGGLFSGNFLVPPKDRMTGVPIPEEWLAYLFCGRELPARHGLYLMTGPPGAPVSVEDQHWLRITPLMSTDQQFVLGVRVWLLGYEFDLLMVNLPAGVRTAFDDAIYRPLLFASERGDVVIEFVWRNYRATEGVALRRAYQPLQDP